MASEPAKLDPPYTLAGKRVWVAGHGGMVGAALIRRLAPEGCEVITVPRRQVDLRRQAAVEEWLADARPQAVFLAAATAGGIHANTTRPGEFMYDNLAIATNAIEASRNVGVEKLMFLGSACIYPRMAPQPMDEEALFSGPLEPTNQWYAVAKIAGITLCQAYRRHYGCDFISAQPNNLYGPGDTFDLQASHVIPALMVKAHKAKRAGDESFEVWGTGQALREFLHVDDLADALVFLMKAYSGDLQINVGTGEELSIGDLARTVAQVVGFAGGIRFDTGRPDGMPRRLLNADRLRRLGWRSRIGLREGLEGTYAWYRDNVDQASKDG